MKRALRFLRTVTSLMRGPRLQSAHSPGSFVASLPFRPAGMASSAAPAGELSLCFAHVSAPKAGDVERKAVNELVVRRTERFECEQALWAASKAKPAGKGKAAGGKKGPKAKAKGGGKGIPPPWARQPLRVD